MIPRDADKLVALPGWRSLDAGFADKLVALHGGGDHSGSLADCATANPTGRWRYS